MTTLLKAVSNFVYEVLFEANSFDQRRIEEAMRLQYTNHVAW